MTPTPSSGGARLRTRGLSKTYGRGGRSLTTVDLDIAAGETLAVLGPSGCGKTTLLRLIAGLETPDAGGEIWFDDENVASVPVERRRVGIVFQSYALFPNMSVAQNIGYGLKLRKTPDAERRATVASLLRAMNLEHFAERRVDNLSGGQRQRVALARALAIRPRVLLLDEPLAALDAALRDHLRGEISTMLRRFGITALYVTHDQGEALEIGDRVAVMREGQIAQIGAARDIYERPANLFVAEFVGVMNHLSAKCAARAGLGARDIWFRPEAAAIAAPDAGGLPGEIVSATFLGAHTRLIVDCAGERVSIVAPASTRAVAGDRVGVQIDPAGILLFDEARRC